MMIMRWARAIKESSHGKSFPLKYILRLTEFDVAQRLGLAPVRSCAGRAAGGGLPCGRTWMRGNHVASGQARQKRRHPARPGARPARRPGLPAAGSGCRARGAPNRLAGGAQVLHRGHELPEQPDAQQHIKQQGKRNERYPDQDPGPPRHAEKSSRRSWARAASIHSCARVRKLRRLQDPDGPAMLGHEHRQPAGAAEPDLGHAARRPGSGAVRSA